MLIIKLSYSKTFISYDSAVKRFKTGLTSFRAMSAGSGAGGAGTTGASCLVVCETACFGVALLVSGALAPGVGELEEIAPIRDLIVLVGFGVFEGGLDEGFVEEP